MEITVERLKMLKLRGFFEPEWVDPHKKDHERTFYFQCNRDNYCITYSESCRVAFDRSNTIKYVTLCYAERRHHFPNNLHSDMLDFVEYLKEEIGYGKLKNQSNIIRKLMITEFMEDPENKD